MLKTDEENQNVVKVWKFEDAFEITGHGRYNYLTLFACCIINMAASIDLFGFSVVVAATSCDMALTISQVGLLASAPFAGLLFSYPWGYFADTKGRKKALILSTSVGFVFAAISSLAVNWQMLLVAKVLGSSFSMASFMLTVTYLGENVTIRKQNKYIFILNSMNLGSEAVTFGLAYLLLPIAINIYIPALAITYKSWRLFTFMMSAPLGIGALLMLFLQESPKYLVDKGEETRSLETLEKIFVMNGGKKEDFVVKGLIIKTTKDENKTSIFSKVFSHMSPLFRPPLLWRTLQLFYLMSLALAIYNVLIMWLPTLLDIVFKSISNQTTEAVNIGFCENIKPVRNVTLHNKHNLHCDETLSPKAITSGFYISLLLAIANLAVTKFASSRRLLLIIIFLIAAASCLMVSVLKHPIASVIFFTLIQATSIGVGSIVSFFVDLYPTSCRGLATSLGFMVGRLSALAGTAIVGVVVEYNCDIIFYVIFGLLLSGILVALLLPTDKKKGEHST